MTKYLFYVVVVALMYLPHETSAATTLPYDYDANGNMIRGEGKYYEYNDVNQLVKIRQGDANGPVMAEYFYDYNGQRVKKVENGVTTYYIGKHYETQVSDFGKTRTDASYYFANGERVAKKDQSGTLSYYHSDHLGGTNAMTNTSGNLVERTKYYPFGEIREGGSEKYSYTGKEKDKLTDWYYYEARFYNPQIKHFTQVDNIEPNYYKPQDLNKFSYVVNNAVANIDPDGHSFMGFASELAQGGLKFAGIFVNAGMASVSFVEGDYADSLSNTIESIDSFNESTKHFSAAVLNGVRNKDIKSDDIEDTALFATAGWKKAKVANNLYSIKGLLNKSSYKSLSYLKDYKSLGKNINKSFLYVKNTKQYYSLLKQYIESEKYANKQRRK
ncbi:RHS repeat domain-containing protein [Geomonas ferrireducens]|uniref:RHS repeat domain-containing protein n=1 Tax=Geomonas ferrireducens TaxID=2570227 RepID=UPI0010A812F3|nr:RHS repeat-associated core domain-containing protein [Geomonas ferrireducens]